MEVSVSGDRVCSARDMAKELYEMPSYKRTLDELLKAGESGCVRCSLILRRRQTYSQDIQYSCDNKIAVSAAFRASLQIKAASRSYLEWFRVANKLSPEDFKSFRTWR
jgi:hypothetical protein